MKREKVLETILILVLALGIFYWFAHTKNPQLAKYLLLGALLLGAIGLFIPSLAAKIHWLWMKLAHGMGWVMSKVILTLIFFLVVLPMSIFSRWAGRNSVKLKQDGPSHYKDRSFTYTKESLENVW